MSYAWPVPDANELHLGLIAERLALKISRGDMIALSGDLGAGKSTFARSLIRALLDDPGAEIPSPTFSLLQTYETPRLLISHIDLYRISCEEEVEELGLADLQSQGAIIVEWPERAPGVLSPNLLIISFREGTTAETRSIVITGFGSWEGRLKRVQSLCGFLDGLPDWREARARYLQGDASARAYARVHTSSANAVLMDFPRQPDGAPVRDGLPYSRIAHLAEDVIPFLAVQGALNDAGLSVPNVFAEDCEQGFLLIEDFGDRVFGQELAAGTSQSELWRAATDTLVALADVPIPDMLEVSGHAPYRVRPLDRQVLAIEAELLLDWYWPAVHGAPCPESARAEFLNLWEPVFARLLRAQNGWVLRDYHSPNLMWLPERTGAQRVGLLDFQDALRGPLAYDLVSLLQDARVDVAAELELELFDYYCAASQNRAAELDLPFLRFSYAALGAQRNTKIAGIFARLAVRDGKPGYLRHLPRIWNYLDRNLRHPELADIRAWYDRNLPPHIMSRILPPGPDKL
jgi:N-acetylmuramate 1-kinase